MTIHPAPISGPLPDWAQVSFPDRLWRTPSPAFSGEQSFALTPRALAVGVSCDSVVHCPYLWLLEARPSTLRAHIHGDQRLSQGERRQQTQDDEGGSRCQSPDCTFTEERNQYANGSVSQPLQGRRQNPAPSANALTAWDVAPPSQSSVLASRLALQSCD